jgi:hypothetical protein
LKETGPRLSPTEVTNWLALMLSVYLGNKDFANWLINLVARDDLSIALDLHALRESTPSGQTVVERFLNFFRKHNSGAGALFTGDFDQRPDISFFHPSYQPSPDYLEAKLILEQMPDADLLAALLASCAVPNNKSIIDIELWNNVVPPKLSDLLRDFGKELEVVELSSGVRISKRVLLLDVLSEVFPGIRRNHHLQDRVVNLRWLTAYVLAFAFGGRLPNLGELKEAYEKPEIVLFAFDSLETHESEQIFQRDEWLDNLYSSEGRVEIRGQEEFEGSYPKFFDRFMSKVMIRRAAPRHRGSKSEVWLDLERGLGDSEPIETTNVNPSRKQFATCRIVFDK